MQPCPPRRISGRKLVSRQVPHADVDRQRAVARDGPIDRDRGGRLFQLSNRRRRRALQLRGCRLHRELGAKPVHEPQHERIAAEERVPRQARALVAEHRGDAHRSRRRRHVARLTAPPLLEKAAVTPLLVVHLLRQRSDRAPIRSERSGDERVARRAQLGLAHVRRLLLLEARHGMHDPPASGVDGHGTEGAPPAVRARRRHDEVAVEAVGRAEAIGRDLMTHGARHAVERGLVERRAGAARGRRQMREERRLAARRVRRLPRGRHVAGGALVLDVRGVGRVIDRLAAHAGLDVRIAGRVRHHGAPPARADRDVLPVRGDEVVVARQAVACGREHRDAGARIRTRRHGGAGRRGQDGTEPHRRREHHGRLHETHLQNSKKPPSNQSHSR